MQYIVIDTESVLVDKKGRIKLTTQELEEAGAKQKKKTQYLYPQLNSK